MAIYDCLKRQQDPIWTQREVEKFWNVMRPYLGHLLGDEMPLPDFNIDFSCLDSNSVKDRQLCMNVVHDCLWKRKYSLAVANLKAVETFFDGENKRRQYLTIADKLRILEDVFKRSPFDR